MLYFIYHLVETMNIIVASNISDAIKKLLEGAIPDPVNQNGDKCLDDILRNFIRTFVIEGDDTIHIWKSFVMTNLLKYVWIDNN